MGQLLEFFSPDVYYLEKEDKMSRTEILAYVLIVFLVIATIYYLLYIAAGVQCSDCTEDEKFALMEKHVGYYFKEFVR